jgi:hypothetical protein
MDSSHVPAGAIAIAIAIFVSLPPASAYAQATTSGINESIETTDNLPTCSGEFVEVEGSDHVVTHSTPGGGYSHDNFQGVDGVSSTGVRYREVGARQDEHSITTRGAGVYIEPVRNNNVISQGPDDNHILHVVSHKTYNANGEVTADVRKAVSRCVG